MSIEKLLQHLKIKPNKISLYYNALTHSTFSNEKVNKGFFSYERMEFFGDAILSFLVSKHLYTKYRIPEGEMTLIRAAVVKKENLAKHSCRMGLNIVMKVGNGAKNLVDNENVQADLFESFLAALFIDQGERITEEFLATNIFIDIAKNAHKENKDPKTLLQEFLQTTSGRKIIYNANKENGRYRAEIIFDGHNFGVGYGETKKSAEQEAARESLKMLTKEKHEID